MRHLLAIAVCLASAVLLPGAPVPKELKVNTDAQRMQGVWLQENGMRWYFDGDKVYVGGNNTTDNKGMGYDLVFRPETTPREIDFGGGKQFQYYAIYRFVGDDLQFSYGGAPRPKDFDPKLGGFHHVFKRLPEGKK